MKLLNEYGEISARIRRVLHIYQRVDIIRLLHIALYPFAEKPEATETEAKIKIKFKKS